jgi:hypothetical protein
MIPPAGTNGMPNTSSDPCDGRPLMIELATAMRVKRPEK